MADETREERAQRVAQEATKLGEKYAEDQRSSAEDAREDEPSAAETEEEYHARIAGARASGIFGDTDTTAGAEARGTDVPSADNEAATVAVAEADAKAEQGDDEAADASDDQARRQPDVSAGTTESAESAEAGAEAREDEESGDDDDVVNQNQDEANEQQAKASDKVREIQSAQSVEDVDKLSDGDDRKTVQEAARKRREELGA